MEPRFIESIRYEGGNYPLLKYHQERVDKTFHYFFANQSPHQLVSCLPSLKLEGIYKVRMLYTADHIDIEYAAYSPRKIESLQLVVADDIDYSFKYEDRQAIERLQKSVSADDILMIKNNSITDCSYSNLAFWDGAGWYTPDTPLLPGVRRGQLLKLGRIKEAPIKPSDLGAFKKMSLINAMLDLGEVEISTNQILKG